MTRRFEISDAKRKNSPIHIGISGPSFSGKTYTALRLASGIIRVQKGPIVVIDTEGGRALHYSDEFQFQHCPFEPPYGSLDYVEALDEALRIDPSVIIVDSGSHEHEGTGGYLDLANQELEAGKREGQNYAKPSVARRRLLSRLQTLPCSTIWCFRAEDKLDWKQVFEKKAKAPPAMGQTIVGTAPFSYEMTVRFLLREASDGVPTWDTELPGEKKAIKRTKPFRKLFAEPRQLSELDGAAMARWAAGGVAEIRTLTDDELEALGAKMLQAPDLPALQACGQSLEDVLLSSAQREFIEGKFKERKRALVAGCRDCSDPLHAHTVEGR